MALNSTLREDTAVSEQNKPKSFPARSFPSNGRRHEALAQTVPSVITAPTMFSVDFLSYIKLPVEI